MKRLFITGASGFIGSHLLRMFCDKGYNGSVLFRKNKPRESKHFSFIKGDLQDINSYKNHLVNIDVVLHLAATTNDWASKKIHTQVNVKGTAKLFEWAVEAGVRHFIFFSSLATVSNPLPTTVGEQSSYQKKLMCHYANSKIAAEKKLINLSKDKKITLTILRTGWVIGKGDAVLVKNLKEHIRSGSILLPSRNLTLPIIGIDRFSEIVSKLIGLKTNASGLNIFHAVDYTMMWDDLIHVVADVMGYRINIKHLHFALIWPICVANYFLRQWTGFSFSKKLVSPSTLRLLTVRNRFESFHTNRIVGMTSAPSLHDLIKESFS